MARAVRSNDEIVSQLPVYAAKRSKDFPGWLIVTCPYEDCADIFLVRASHWRRNRVYRSLSGREHTITGRSCPYCFRAARLAPRGSVG